MPDETRSPWNGRRAPAFVVRGRRAPARQTRTQVLRGPAIAESGHKRKPTVLVTGAGGRIGTALSRALRRDYQVIGLDRDCSDAVTRCIEFDLASDESVDEAMDEVRKHTDGPIAAVVHLAAYFDFTGKDNPLYDEINVKGSRRLVEALQTLDVERFIYSGTMLVHEPQKPGRRIDEDTPLAPGWAYPESKAAAEKAIREARGAMPVTFLHLAGLYDDKSAVPTLSHQIARTYERNFKSHLYAGDPNAGQSFIHIDDMLDVFRRVIERRNDLPDDVTILAGEPEAVSYDALQEQIGQLIHGEDEWQVINLPKPLAKAGAWAEEKSEPVVPDAIDQGEKPFLRPFMIDLAEDHYALDISRAKKLLGWRPRHDIRDGLEEIVGALKADPPGWYAANGITPPQWLQAAEQRPANEEKLRARHERTFRETHQRFLWAHFVNIALGLWIAASAGIYSHGSALHLWTDIGTGAAITVFATFSLSWRFAWARWVCAVLGVWLLFAPLVFWTPSAAAYLNDTVIGMLVIGFAVLVRPTPGIAVEAAAAGPDVPQGWSVCPSSWTQRLPIIGLAVVGFLIARHLTAYQLGHIPGVWEPFFAGGPDPKNGTEEIITSYVSEAFPIPDAGLGAATYMLEILVGIIGTSARWRTMPWLTLLFGIMIVPLGLFSIGFIIIQPILLGTWCTLCLIQSAAMLLQIPYSLDELVASGQFLVRRKRAGDSLLRTLFRGALDNGDTRDTMTFERSPGSLIKDSLAGGVGAPWNLLAAIAIGAWLMLTRLTLDASGGMANGDHLIGALVIVVSVTAFAEIGRAARFALIPLGSALLVTPFAFGVDWVQMAASIACGLALIGLAFPRGRITQKFGSWQKFVF